MTSAIFAHRFVESTPVELEDRVLYVSVKFRVVVHLCACGCKNKVVTPLRPAKWEFTFNGDSISMWPSIGNWQFPCKSHYLVIRDRIEWCKPWTEKEIAEGRANDARDSQRYYAVRRNSMSSEALVPVVEKLHRNLIIRRWKTLRRRQK